MNYRSLEKIMDDRVTEALKKSVPDCKATIRYLELCKQLTANFLEENITPIERIYKAWNAVYFLRFWRQWILKSKKHCLKKNFISLNAFVCAEINAHALVELVVKLRATPNMFLTKSFSSQVCESIFRQTRSMGTMNLTKINFTLNELFHIVSRIEMVIKISFTYKDITFPRIKYPSQTQAPPLNPLPSDEEIVNIMKAALNDAQRQAGELSLISADDTVNDNCLNSIINCDIQNDDLVDDLDDIMEEAEEVEITNMDTLVDTDLDADDDTGLEAGHRYVDIHNPDGSTKLMPISTLIWILANTKGHLSSERIRRVMGQTNS